MKRGMERVAVRAAWLMFAGVTLLAIGMVALLVARPPVPAEIPDVKMPSAQPSMPVRDQILKDLANSRMTAAVEVGRVEPPKRIVIPLSSLIRLRGTMDMGDPAKNVAIIENLRTNETSSYVEGKTVEGVGAKILKIDQGVTFSYEGAEVRLEVPRVPETGYGPLTGPGQGVETAKQK